MNTLHKSNDSFKAEKRKQITKVIRKAKKEARKEFQQPKMYIPSKRNHK